MPADATPLASLLKGFSIEVTPRTLAQVYCSPRCKVSIGLQP